MIRAIGQNDVLEALLLMKQSTEQNEYKNTEYNENAWITFFCNLVDKQSKQDPNALVIGYYDNTLKGFLSASTFNSYYNNSVIMDVRDCIVDKNNKNNGKIVIPDKWWGPQYSDRKDQDLRPPELIQLKAESNYKLNDR